MFKSFLTEKYKLKMLFHLVYIFTLPFILFKFLFLGYFTDFTFLRFIPLLLSLSLDTSQVVFKL